jgi:hypothetical protein
LSLVEVNRALIKVCLNSILINLSLTLVSLSLI